jgi:hypothetical protein
MTSPATSSLRDELNTALDVLLPELEGWEDLASMEALQPSTMGFVTDTITGHRRRHNLIQNLLDALDALEADLYPDTPKIKIPTPGFEDLHHQLDVITSALNEAEEQPVASDISVDLGAPADKVAPAPLSRKAKKEIPL